MDVVQGCLILDQVILFIEVDGKVLKVDFEGIVKVVDGFWIVLEGKIVVDNQFIKVNMVGVVQQCVKLFVSVQIKFVSFKISIGYEGVIVSVDGQMFYMVVQCGFDLNKFQVVILKLYLFINIWIMVFYLLDQYSKDVKKYWMGLFEIQFMDDGCLLLFECDKGGGEGQVINVEVKCIYSVKVVDVIEGVIFVKILVCDLCKDFNYVQEKVEGMVVFKGDFWVVNDNDGVGWICWVNVGWF